MDIPPNATLYVKNVTDKVKKESLKRQLYLAFSAYGRVIDVVVMKGEQLRSVRLPCPRAAPRLSVYAVVGLSRAHSDVWPSDVLTHPNAHTRTNPPNPHTTEGRRGSCTTTWARPPRRSGASKGSPSSASPWCVAWWSGGILNREGAI